MSNYPTITADVHVSGARPSPRMDRTLWKVKDYQRALAARGAKISGRKKDLEERLAAYERNDNFGAQPIIIETQDPVPFPDISKFRTLTPAATVVPKITKPHVEVYVHHHQALGEKMGEAKAIEKGEKLLNDNCVLAISFFLEPVVTADASSTAPTAAASTSAAQLSPDDVANPILYISGLVEAEMKTKFAYSLKLVLDGFTGEILQGHCECPAGRGPVSSCKHNVAVLLALVKFAKEGVLQVKLSCTEEIQSFKKPTSSHKGEPVRADNLGKGYNEDYDPRPKKYRNMKSKADYITNATINFCAQSGLDITRRYASTKHNANLGAAEQDHDYLEEPLVTY